MRVFNFIFVTLLLIASMPPAVAEDADSNYRLGNGYSVGNTGIRLGGYASAEIGAPRKAPKYFDVNDLSLFLTWDNGSRLRFFSELEMGDAVSAREPYGLGTQDAHFEFERGYLDLLINNNLTVRIGKFLTPIGQWNVIHAAPLVWTSSRPVVTEDLFSTHVSGLMAHGSLFISGRQLEYSVYGDLSDDIDPHRSSQPFENAIGTHLRYFFNDELQLGASFSHYALNEPLPVRYYLSGFDVAWSHKKIELSSEIVYRASDHGNVKNIWQGFIQSAIPVPINPHWFVVGRYEFFEQTLDHTGQIGLLGLAYRPLPPVIWKFEYRLGVHNELLTPDGPSVSLAILF